MSRLPHFTLGPVDQLAYVVDDLEATALLWAARGAGPFFRYTPNVTYVGADPKVAAEVATGSFRNVLIKLMIPVAGGFLPAEPGLHSLVMMADDLDSACAAFGRQGLATVLRAETTDGTRFAFVDAVAESGHHWEILEASARMCEYYARLAAAAEDWDGSDPFRG